MTNEEIISVESYLDGLLSIGWEKVNGNQYRKRRTLNIVSVSRGIGIKSNYLDIIIQVIVAGIDFMDVREYSGEELAGYALRKDYSIFDDKDGEWYKANNEKIFSEKYS